MVAFGLASSTVKASTHMPMEPSKKAFGKTTNSNTPKRLSHPNSVRQAKKTMQSLKPHLEVVLQFLLMAMSLQTITS